MYKYNILIVNKLSGINKYKSENYHNDIIIHF